VLVVHNDIVGAIDQGHVAALTLLDLSSTFDIVDSPYHSKIQIFGHKSIFDVVPLIPH